MFREAIRRNAATYADQVFCILDRERTEILNKGGQRMQEVVSKLAEEKGFDLVVDTSNAVYFKAAMEITNEAIAAYDKKYPLAK